MTKIAVLGDTHIDVKCSSRTDDYLDTCVKKFAEVADTVGEGGHIIVLGDMFHRPSVPAYAVVTFLTLLNKLRLRNINVHTILGNHDVYNYREQSLVNTNVGILQAAGVLDVLLPDNVLSIDNFSFYTSYVDLDKCKQHISSFKVLDTSSVNIMLLHQHIDGVHSGVTYDELKSLQNIKYIIFGHEHSPMQQLFEQLDDKLLWRLGACLRNTADSFNLDRIPMYLVFDTKNGGFEIYTFETAQQGVDIFNDDAYNKTNLKKKQFIQSIDEVLSRYNTVHVKPTLTMYGILKEINTPQANLNYLEGVYSRIGKDFK